MEKEFEPAESTKRILHVEETIEMFGQAEEQLRRGNDDGCLELKEEFQERCNTYTEEEKKYVDDYIETMGW